MNLPFSPEMLLAAARQQQYNNLQLCFDSARPDSRPTEAQQAILDDIEKILHRYVVAGNQCKPFYSLVKMADGSLRQIGTLQEGEEVLAYDKKEDKQVPAKITKVWRNGCKEVFRYFTGGQYTDSTVNHAMPRYLGGKIVKTPIGKCTSLLKEDCREGRNWVSVDIEQVVSLGEMEVYDITIDHEDHIYVCDGYYTGNSGKSSLGARELSWILNGTHPTWKRPARWGSCPLLVIVAGQSRDIIEHGLWVPKLKPMLIGDWREVKKSGSLMSAVNRATGDKIVFLPHGDAAEDTISNMQTYVAHYVWLDEMPKKSKILTELLQRITAYGGYMFATFTPLSVSAEVKRIIDSVEAPYGRKYAISKLDNPLFIHEKERILKEAAGWSMAERMTRLYGAWAVAETAVYEFDYNRMSASLPSTYQASWRHVLSVDPASSSKTGISNWAEDPSTGIWYCIRADYLTIKDPKKLIEAIANYSRQFNTVKYISDVNPMFVSLAHSEQKISFVTPWNKTQRKDQLIKQLQIALSEGKILLTPGCELAIEEFDTCRHKEDESGNIVNAQRFHILDTFQYFVDGKPKPTKEYVSTGFDLHQHILREDEKRRKQEFVKQQHREKRASIRIRRKR